MTTALIAPAPARSAVDRETALRRVLLADAVVTGANGLAYLAGATVLDGLLGVPAGTLRPIGAFLVVFAGGVALVATRRPIPGAAPSGHSAVASSAAPSGHSAVASSAAVRALVAGNVLWVVASLAVAATGALDASGVGTAWIVLQAVAVAGFAVLQAWALRRP